MKIVRDIGITEPLPTPPKPKQRNRPRSTEFIAAVEAFKRFNPGDSFFVAGMNNRQAEKFREPFTAAGLRMTVRETECDPIYKTAGVRIWRRLGHYDLEEL